MVGILVLSPILKPRRSLWHPFSILFSRFYHIFRCNFSGVRLSISTIFSNPVHPRVSHTALRSTVKPAYYDPAMCDHLVWATKINLYNDHPTAWPCLGRQPDVNTMVLLLWLASHSEFPCATSWLPYPRIVARPQIFLGWHVGFATWIVVQPLNWIKKK